MKTLLLSFLAFFILSCGNRNKTVNQDQPFFHFDRIDYYRKNVSENYVDSILRKENKSRQEQALMQILDGNVPISTMDTLFIRNMEMLSFEKYKIDPRLNTKISHLFSLRTVSEPAVAACEPIYRDILIFREKGKVIGVAKICFDCGLNQIVGARYDSSEFGMSGEYKELYKILKTQWPAANTR